VTIRSTHRHASSWRLDGSVAAYSLIGAALYGLLGLYAIPFGPAVVRPGFAIVPFVGFSFGPVAGFASGFIGQGIVEGISGSPGYSWIHGLAAGLAGLVAGLAPLYVLRLIDGTLRQRAIAGGIAGVVGSIVGGLVLLLPGAGGDPLQLFMPQVVANAIVSLVLVPAIVFAWEPLGESMAS
jgi:energy-coupling factor transport system substrate-specific component